MELDSLLIRGRRRSSCTISTSTTINTICSPCGSRLSLRQDLSQMARRWQLMIQITNSSALVLLTLWLWLAALLSLSKVMPVLLWGSVNGFLSEQQRVSRHRAAWSLLNGFYPMGAVSSRELVDIKQKLAGRRRAARSLLHCLPMVWRWLEMVWGRLEMVGRWFQMVEGRFEMVWGRRQASRSRPNGRMAPRPLLSSHTWHHWQTSTLAG